MAIWLAIYAGATSSDGVSLQQMVTYTLLGGAVLGAIRYESIIGGIGQALKTGEVAVWLLKPASFPLYVLTSELGRAAFRLLFLVAPTVIVVALVYGMLPPATPLDGVMFIPYLLHGYAICALISALFGLIAFWLTSFSLEWPFQAILNLLSGSLIPLWFFQQPFGAIAATCHSRGSSTTLRRCGSADCPRRECPLLRDRDRLGGAADRGRRATVAQGGRRLARATRYIDRSVGMSRRVAWSRIKTEGSVRNVLANATICLCPAERRVFVR